MKKPRAPCTGEACYMMSAQRTTAAQLICMVGIKTSESRLRLSYRTMTRSRLKKAKRRSQIQKNPTICVSVCLSYFSSISSHISCAIRNKTVSDSGDLTLTSIVCLSSPSFSLPSQRAQWRRSKAQIQKMVYLKLVRERLQSVFLLFR